MSRLNIQVLGGGRVRTEPKCPRCDDLPEEVVAAYLSGPDPVRFHGPLPIRVESYRTKKLVPPQERPALCPTCSDDRIWLHADGAWKPVCRHCDLAGFTDVPSVSAQAQKIYRERQKIFNASAANKIGDEVCALIEELKKKLSGVQTDQLQKGLQDDLAAAGYTPELVGPEDDRLWYLAGGINALKSMLDVCYNQLVECVVPLELPNEPADKAHLVG